MGDFWQATIEILQSESQPLVRKPKLTEKLLSKPPFRFLHDVISEVQRNTSFAPGLYDEDEQVADNVKDKSKKITYLEKMMLVVSQVLGESVPADPLKIVAGLDPENTNTFLQQLGRAALMGPNEAVVHAVLASLPAPAAEDAPPPPEPQPQLPAMPPAPLLARPSTAKRDTAPPPPIQSIGAPAPPAITRPQSARKAPPKPKELGSIGMQLGEAHRPAPVVYREGSNDDEDVEVEMVATDARGKSVAKRREGPGGALTRDILRAEEELAREGGTSGRPEATEPTVGSGIKLGGRRKARTEGGGGGGGGGGVQSIGSRDDMEAVRESIQKLCQSTNPLGRYLELLAEDMDSLGKELTFWREERRIFEAKLEEMSKAETGGGEVGTRESPVVQKLDEEIEVMRDAIVAVKSTILQQDEQIGRLIGVMTK